MFFLVRNQVVILLDTHLIQLLWNKVLNGTKKAGIIVSFFCSSLFSVYDVRCGDDYRI